MKALFSAIVLTGIATIWGFCPATTTKFHLKTRHWAEKNEWVERDMKDAGKAEHESDDWVADDMERLGSQVGQDRVDDDWVARDMTRTGRAASHPAQKRRVEGEDAEHVKNWDIAKDMKRTGKTTDWIARDMEEAGRPDTQHGTFATEHWLNKLDQELTGQERHRKDVQKDMEETGRRGSDTSLQVRVDMEQTGHATNPLEVLQDFFHSITYKLNEWTEKAFDVSYITREMQDAGKASTENSWVKHDMEETGKQGHEHVHSLREQNKDLQDDLTKSQHEDVIAKDMAHEGRPDFSFHSKRSEYRRSDLVYEDMKLAGSSGGSVSEERIRQDMETAGHAEGFFSHGHDTSAKDTQYRKEMEALNRQSHARPKAPVEGKAKIAKKLNADVQGTHSTDEGPVVQDEKKVEADEPGADSTNDEPKKHREFGRHLVKKVMHPRTPWKEL